MEVAALVIGILPVAAKIAKICYEYGESVKTAEADVKRLHDEVESVISILKSVEKVSKEQKQLPAPQELLSALAGCRSDFENLEKRLDAGKKTKWKRLGGRALKWPLQSKEVDKLINDLERRKQTISVALQGYQTTLAVGLHGKFDRADLDRVLASLPQAKGARFDSHEDEHHEGCLENTRVELLKEIQKWVEDPQSKSIFWLDGMAGTGKSTISRTVAQSLAKKGQLGASFFFKRGEADRSNTVKFFTTIAAQLAEQIPEYGQRVKTALEKNPGISEKHLSEQFKQLILHPLEQEPKIHIDLSRLVIVIDALDECEREQDIRTILLLLSQIQKVASTPVRIFVTSRPEPPIRLTFNEIGDLHQNLVLHNVPQAIVGDDIALYLNHEFKKIQRRRGLAETWPNPDDVRILVDMAIPLFIFAATVVRFVSDNKWTPQKRLATILESRSRAQASKYDPTYLPVLEQLLVDQSKRERETIEHEFHEVVGTIITLADPLSVHSLATILGMEKDDVENRLDPLHSVISVPKLSSLPVKLFHLSFRDFLVDEEKRGDKHWFWIDERKAHEVLSHKCLKLLSHRLKENMCNLASVGASRHEIDTRAIEDCLPADIQYSCRYWVFHLEQSQKVLQSHQRNIGQSQTGLPNHGLVEIFLREHLLHWLETLSILGLYTEGIGMIRILLSMSSVKQCPGLHAFVVDMERFVLSCRIAVDLAPLQVYSSALIFAPVASLVRKQFAKSIPAWVRTSESPQKSWDGVLQVLEGFESSINIVRFSPDGSMLAACCSSPDLEASKLWDPETGALLQTYDGKFVGFSPDSQRIVIVNDGLDDSSISLCDIASGTIQQKVVMKFSKVHLKRRWFSAKFTPDGKVVAYTCGYSDFYEKGRAVDSHMVEDEKWSHNIQLWDVVTGKRLSLFEDTWSLPCFSLNSLHLAVGITVGKVLICKASTGAVQRTLETGEGRVTDLAFAPDGPQLAVALVTSGNGRPLSLTLIQLWNWATGELVHQIEPGYVFHGLISDLCLYCQYVDNGRQLALWIPVKSEGHVLRLWNPANGVLQHTLKIEVEKFFDEDEEPVDVISANGQLFVRDFDGCHQWDAATGIYLQYFNHSEVIELAVSADGQRLAMALNGRSILILDTALAHAEVTTHTYAIPTPDLTLMATWTYYDESIVIRDTMNGDVQRTLWTSAYYRQQQFSSSGRQLAMCTTNSTIELLDIVDGTRQTLQCPTAGIIRKFWFVRGGRWLAVHCIGNVFIWDITTGILSQTWRVGGNPASIEVCPDSNFLAVVLPDCTIQLLHNGEGSATLQPGHSLGTKIVYNIEFTRDGKGLLISQGLTMFSLWDLETATLVWEVKDTYVSSVISADGTLLVTVGDDSGVHRISIRETDTGTLLHCLSMPYTKTYHVPANLDFSADESWIESPYGIIHVHRSTSTARPPQVKLAWGLHIEGQWLRRGEGKLLWLPVSYRAEKLDQCRAAYRDGVVTFWMELQSGGFFRLDIDA